MKYLTITFFTLLLISQDVSGQVTLGNETYHILDRLSVKTGYSDNFHSVHLPYTRQDVINFANKVDTLISQPVDGGFTIAYSVSGKDRIDLSYLFKDNNDLLPDIATHPKYIESKKTLLTHFYKTPANLYQVDTKDFKLRANPVLFEKVGYESQEDLVLFRDVKGVEFRGSIDDKIHFYTNLHVHAARFPNFLRQRINERGEVPYAGLFKQLSSDGFYASIYGQGGVIHDYLTAQGNISFHPTKHVNVTFGHGQNFIGNGMRSLFLSDYANNYLYLKLNTKIWKFDYQNIFTEMSTTSRRNFISGDVLLPKKYLAAHHLSLNITPNLNVGLFEAVVFARENAFELNYLNPIIIYRTVEHSLGSPDNVYIGADVRWNIFKTAQLYGQFILDEWKLDELFGGEGWWANKYGLQLGVKYFDVLGVDHLDGQLEYNVVRPYTYTHRGEDNQTSYTHFSQPLAHPLGANFREVLGTLRYKVNPKLALEGTFMIARTGLDTLDSNWGGNIFLPYTTREQEYGNVTGQGINTSIMTATFKASYQVFHNMFVDFDVMLRNQDSAIDAMDMRTTYFGVGLRVNFWERPYLF